MTKNSFQQGSASLPDFLYWINERHRIWINRFEKKQSWPWTKDPILQSWKFTNVFRQLDRGTVALHKMLAQNVDFQPQTPPPEYKHDKKVVLFNIIWYRLFNLENHALHFAREKVVPSTYTEIKDYLYAQYRTSQKIFTSAHMTTGVAGEDKVFSYCRATEKVFLKLDKILSHCTTMEALFKYLLDFYMIGPFVAYEIVCDARWCGLVPVTNTWANVGPGAERGLLRLGLPPALDSMINLLKEVVPKLEPHVIMRYPPFELREIEHSLCEFDKYMRVKTNRGRPKQRYIPPDNKKRPYTYRPR